MCKTLLKNFIFRCILLFAIFPLAVCENVESFNPEPETQPFPTGTIVTYTAVQTGGNNESGNRHSTTGIDFEFSHDIDSLNLEYVDVYTMNDSATAELGKQLTGDGKFWHIDISGVTKDGAISLMIDKNFIEDTVKTIDIYRGPAIFTAEQQGGSPYRTASTDIKFTFDIPVPELTADNITITPSAKNPGSAEKGTITAEPDSDNRIWTLSLESVSTQGFADISFNSPYVENGTKTVVVCNEKLDFFPEFSQQTITNSTGLTSLLDIVYSAEKSLFVAVGASGKIIKSSDGMSWSAASNLGGNSKELRSVAYGGGKFVAVGGNSSNANSVIMYSADGDVWIRAAIDSSWKVGSVPSKGFSNVIYAKGLFVVSSGSTGADTPLLWSDDGETWHKGELSDGSKFTTSTINANNILPVVFDGYRFLAISRNWKFAESYDGKIWQPIPEYDIGLSGTALLEAAAYTGGRYFVALSTNKTIFHSTDALSWNTVQLPTSGYTNIVFHNNKYFIGTTTGIYCCNDTELEFGQWGQFPDNKLGSLTKCAAFAEGAGKFIVVGTGGAGIAYLTMPQP
jgi:hypothetical protein